MSHIYRRTLINELASGAKLAEATGEAEHPAQRWAGCGLMALTGQRDGEPQLAPAPLPHCADAALDVFRTICGQPVLSGWSGAQLLTERAACFGFTRNGDISNGGSCRLLPVRDGTLALNLARPSDWELLHAWLQTPCEPAWPAVARAIAKRGRKELVARGIELGLAVADANTATTLPAWYQRNRHGKPRLAATDHAPRVLDLSSLWAGPLCSHLWQQAGAEVIKVESRLRPDGARTGSPVFFALLNNGKQTLSLDLHTPDGQQCLRQLIAEADIVLEGSRPRALRQMGIIAEDLIAAQPGLTWLSISGYGRAAAGDIRIAYGDDAAVAGGLSRLLHECTGQWLFCGDAIADPLTGLHAAIAGWSAWQRGGGELIALSLAGTVQHCVSSTAPDRGDHKSRWRAWRRHLEQHDVAVLPPAARTPTPPC